VSKNLQHIVVLGAGESGVGAAILAKTKGFTVFVSDAGKIKQQFRDELNSEGIEWEEGGHSNKIQKADLVIKSPGIPNTAATIQNYKQRNIPVIGEIEFAARYTKAKLIAITGSNGKTTTTHLTHHVLKKGGLNVEMAGNMGESLARKVLTDSQPDVFVIELSSFQLEDMYDFRADISIMLNITPDHLDRYEYNMENYAMTKFRITQNQTTADYFIYNADDAVIAENMQHFAGTAQKIPFSLKQRIENGGYATNEKLIITIKNKLTMSIHELALKGKHNTQNSLVAGIAGRIMEIRKESVRESLTDFTNVEHRLEFVAKVNGIEFINDSKATNVNSTWYALESMDKPTVWIVGGVDKGNDYDELLPLVNEKVKAIICLGTDNSKILETFNGKVETIVEAGSALEAVIYGYRLARNGETVLLSPACASFDLFENYEDRGQQFKEAVRSL
jgi:UDP-N-acetylmuramoylalanine--D-glutamate ligase